MEGHVRAGWGSQRGRGGGARGTSGHPGALQGFPLCWGSFSQAHCTLRFASLSSVTAAECAAWHGAGRHCRSSGAAHPVPFHPALCHPIPPCPVPSHPIPSVLSQPSSAVPRTHLSPSPESGVVPAPVAAGSLPQGGKRRWMRQSGAERQLITLPSVSCKLRAN